MSNLIKKIEYVLLILSVLFSFHCNKAKWEGEIYTQGDVKIVQNKGSGLWEGDEGKDISFEETLSLGLEEGEDHLMFYRLRDLAVDSDLNIYAMDAGNHRIIKFDKNGQFLWETGRKGQGPGEFQYPRNISFSPENEVVVGDGRRVHFFSKQGEYLRTIRLNKMWQNFYFLPDGRILVSLVVRGRPGVAAEIHTSEGEFIEKFPDEYRYGPELSMGGGLSIGGVGIQLLGNQIYFALPDQYEIRTYDLEGNLFRKIKRNIKLKPPNIKVTNISGNTRVSVGPSDCSGPCFAVDQKYLINSLRLVNRKGEKKYETEHFLEFFNTAGQFLKRIETPEGRELNAIDSQENFYFIQTNPFPKIIRASLKIE
ncbi:MAG: hypothetical protein GF421_09730 [Candidatus Aminicenantes bacterium]|nr:hypothetical protein [Candidatus Aminicenantes bacterium]